jgi:glycosyltransferase involved in cell wall biosynthesis
MRKSGLNKILLILNLPPPYGGGEVRAEYLYNYLINNEKYIIISNSRKKSNKSKQGKISLSNICFGIKLFFRTLYYILYYKPTKLYIGIPKEFYAFIKTGLLISIAYIFKIKIYGELAGESFIFMRKNNYQKKIGLFFLRKISDLRVLSPSIKLQLSNLSLPRITVLENGIYVPLNIDLTSDFFISETLNILFVGALNYSKGIKNIIESILLLKNEKIKFHFHIMGEWSNKIQKDEIFNYIIINDLSKFITFYGLVTSNLKWAIYRKCHILAHPTYWDGQPLVILEAMGFGLTIISTNIGAIPYTMKNNINGLILFENTPQELSKAIMDFYKNRSSMWEISKRNIETFKKRFTLEAYLIRMVNWLDS